MKIAGKRSAARTIIFHMVLVGVVSLVIFSGGGVVMGLLNPHIKPEPCESCHRKIPTKEDVQAGEYFLLQETIDETCHVCHEYSCCKVGDLHGANHPSNIDKWDPKFANPPKKLPLYNGYITCSTCHLHSKREGKDYKLVRLVKIDVIKNDWTELCQDCHAHI